MAASAGNGTLSAAVNASSVTFAHNNNGSTLIVGGVNETSLSGATYNGSAMTLVGTLYTVATSGTGLAHAIWKHLIPASGSNNVVVSGGADNMRALAMSAVDAGDVRSVSSDTGNSGTASTTPASTHADDVVFDFGHFYNTSTYTTGANQTAFGSGTTAGNFSVYGSWQDGANGAAMTATFTSNLWRTSAVSIRAAGVINFGGFEHGHPSALSVPHGDFLTYSGTLARGSILTSGMKHGTRALRLEDLGGSFAGLDFTVKRPDGSDLNLGTLDVYVWFYPITAGANGKDIISVDGGGALQWVGSSFTIIGQGSSSSSALAITQNAWNLLHLHFASGTNASYVQVGSGATATFTSHGGVRNVVTLGIAGNLWNSDCRMDSWVISTTTLDYEPEVQYLPASAAGSNSGWTGAYTDVDEIEQDNDTTYISTSSAAVKHSVACADLSGSPTVKLVKPVAYVRDEGGASSIETFVRVGGTDYENDENVDPGAAYKQIGALLDINPNTAAEWTASGVNGTEAGVKNNNAVAVRCTELGLMVLLAASAPDPDRVPRPVSISQAVHRSSLW